MRLLETGIIVSREIVHPGLGLLRIDTPKIAAEAFPGQFVHIRVAPTTDPLLRRPFSLQRVSGSEIELMVKAYGRGSGRLYEQAIGEAVDILGPLGTGWQIPDDCSSVIGVSGGVGVAPVLFQQQRWNSSLSFHHFIGARTGSDVPLTDQLIDDYRISVATDNGDRGYHGTVVDCIAREFQAGKFGKDPFFIVCGPWMMMKAMKHFVVDNQLRGQFSAEARMGCAVGVCQGCALATPQTETNSKRYALCCKDGPVFDFAAIDMEVNPFGN